MRRILFSMMCLATLSVSAQKIDFNPSGKKGAKITEQGFLGWSVARTVSDTLPKVREGVAQWTDGAIDLSQGGTQLPEGMSIVVTNSKADASTVDLRYGVVGAWGGGKKVESNTKSKIPDDFVCTTTINADGNEEAPTELLALRFIIKGMKAGAHTLLAYHSVSNHGGATPPMVKAQVNGVDACEPVQQSVFIDGTWQGPDDIAQTFINFTAVDGQDVVIDYVPVVPDGVEVTMQRVYVNAFVFDAIDPNMKVTNMSPANNNLHVDAAGNAVTLSWKGSASAASHRLMFGTSEENMAEVQNTTAESYTATGLSCLNTYYWRVDEVPAAGDPVLGDVFTFRINHLAFPGAEGYGRYAIGGRGGQVVHVTSLEDTSTEGVPDDGTLRFALETVKGPRTVVFDVSGIITLNKPITVNESYVTIAGQTAPGDGILIRGGYLYPGSESIVRFIRHRMGSVINEDKGTGYSGFTIQGRNNTIVDHVSVGWATAETFKSAGNFTDAVTVQNTIIAEALTNGNGGSDNFGYGFEAGGETGSYHHNLMASNYYGNPTISGGQDAAFNWLGSNEFFNNVAYNWMGGAARGSSSKLNFSGNYYKAGPATSVETSKILSINIPDRGQGSITYFVSDNVLEKGGSQITTDLFNVNLVKDEETGEPKEGGYEPVSSDTKVVNTGAYYETALTAYARVLSEAGASLKRDATDKRIISEVANGTSSKGENGMIASVMDEDYDVYEIVKRADDFDANQNGIADWYETATGKTEANADPDGDGYTNLEDYLNYMATPNTAVDAGQTASFDLTQYFAGLSGATYSVAGKGTVDGSTLKVTPASTDTGILQSKVTATKGDVSVTREFNVYINGTQTGIQNVLTAAYVEYYELYNSAGILVEQGQAGGTSVNQLNLRHVTPGVYILKIKDTEGRSRSFSLLKK